MSLTDPATVLPPLAPAPGQAARPPPAPASAPRIPASRTDGGRASLPRLRPGTPRHRRGQKRTARVSSGVVVRDRAFRPQVRLPVLQPVRGGPAGTAPVRRCGVSAHARAANRTRVPDARAGAPPRAAVPEPGVQRCGPRVALADRTDSGAG